MMRRADTSSWPPAARPVALTPFERVESNRQRRSSRPPGLRWASSRPPPAPTAPANTTTPEVAAEPVIPRSRGAFADDVDIDKLFADVTTPDSLGSRAPADDGKPMEFQLAGDAADLAELQQLFAQIAATYARPVRDFMIELSWGETTREWVDICRPIIDSMRQFAAKLDYFELCAALDEFASRLEQIATDRQATIEGEARDKLVAIYTPLASLIPGVFSLDDDLSRREPIIIHSLLGQIPDVGKVTIDKIY